MRFRIAEAYRPSASTIGMVLGIAVLVAAITCIYSLLPNDIDRTKIAADVREACHKVTESTCESIESIGKTMSARIRMFQDSAVIWGTARAAIIILVVVSGVITSIYIANSAGKGDREVSPFLKLLGATAAFLTPTFLGLYGAFNLANKPEDLRNTALELIELNNTIAINRCRPTGKTDPPAKTNVRVTREQYCDLTAEERSLISAFNKKSISGFNVLTRIDDSHMRKSAAHAQDAGK